MASAGSSSWRSRCARGRSCSSSTSPAPGSLRASEAAEAESLILPLYPELGEDDQAYVIDQLAAALTELGA